MSTPKTQTAAQIAAFHARNSPEGRLVRYARGRVRSFGARQIPTVLGSVTLSVLHDPLTGIVTALIALIGEAVDCLFLAAAPRYLSKGWTFERLKLLSTFTAGFQALTISICVLIASAVAEANDGAFFVMAFLAGAAINAGIVLSFHPWAGRTRLCIFALTGVGHFCIRIWLEGTATFPLLLDAAGVVMTVFLLKVFLSEVARSNRLQNASKLHLLTHTAELEAAHDILNQNQCELRRLALVAENANDIVMILDRFGTITWVNAAFTVCLGYSAQDAIGQKAADLLIGPDTDMAQVEAVGRALTEGRATRCDILNYTRQGIPIWLDINLVPVMRDGQVDMIIGIERDVTKARHDARQLAQAKLAAEAAARAKATFLATVSHEIRTPMNGIIGMTELLSEQELNAESRCYVDTMRTSSEALLKIINDILDFSRLDAGKVSVDASPFGLVTCVRGVVDLLRPQTHDKGLFLDLAFDGNVPETLVGDSGRIRQILINLIGNAIKFTNSGGVAITVTPKPGQSGTDLEIRVRDTGPGVPETRRTAIFEQFEQADNQITREHGGTGLGLAISRKLAQQMGGELVLEPPIGRGSCFRLSLTLAHAPPAQETTVQNFEQDRPQVPLAGMSVLLAEDNPVNQRLIKGLLRDQGLNLIFADNGAEAVRQVRENTPDAILMDMSMPILDGLGATQAIRALNVPQPFIIALTANAFDTDQVACRAAGMDRFLTKPVRKAQVLAMLRQARQPQTDEQILLGPSPPTDVSRQNSRERDRPWTSLPESGTTSGKSTPLSDP